MLFVGLSAYSSSEMARNANTEVCSSDRRFDSVARGICCVASTVLQSTALGAYKDEWLARTSGEIPRDPDRF